MSDKCKVGERVRTYRQRLEMTIEALSEKSGVNLDVITAIEAGEVYPALGVLVRISRALGQRLGTFMDDQFHSDPVVIRAGERSDEQASPRVGVSNGFCYFPLGQGKTDRHMEPFYIEIAADANALTSSHEGEEFIVVVSGQIELRYGGETHILEPGDSAYYNSVVKHLVTAANHGPATIYAVIFMPF
jgi:quercetin dioxygenase-like cupin family protein